MVLQVNVFKVLFSSGGKYVLKVNMLITQLMCTVYPVKNKVLNGSGSNLSVIFKLYLSGEALQGFFNRFLKSHDLGKKTALFVLFHRIITFGRTQNSLTPHFLWYISFICFNACFIHGIVFFLRLLFYWKGVLPSFLLKFKWKYAKMFWKWST